MTPTERLARAHRAQSAWDEFVSPMFAEMRNEYARRMVEVSNTELNRERRADAIATLSVALKVMDNLEGGMREAIHDGEIAHQEKLRAAKIEQMSDAQQKLLRIGVI